MLKKFLTALVLCVSVSTTASDSRDRVIALNDKLQYQGYFIDLHAVAIFVSSETDEFTLMLDEEGQIWFDDSFVLSEAEKQKLLPHLVRMLSEVDDKLSKDIFSMLVMACGGI